MFEQLFSPRHPKVLARHREGPLAEDLIRYLDHLAKQGVPSCALRLRCWYLRGHQMASIGRAAPRRDFPCRGGTARRSLGEAIP